MDISLVFLQTHQTLVEQELLGAQAPVELADFGIPGQQTGVAQAEQVAGGEPLGAPTLTRVLRFHLAHKVLEAAVGTPCQEMEISHGPRQVRAWARSASRSKNVYYVQL
jgi:hypothetical protein